MSLPHTDILYVVTLEKDPAPGGEDQYPFVVEVDVINGDAFPVSTDNLSDAMQGPVEAPEPLLKLLRSKWPDARSIEVEITYREVGALSEVAQLRARIEAELASLDAQADRAHQDDHHSFGTGIGLGVSALRRLLKP